MALSAAVQKYVDAQTARNDSIDKAIDGLVEDEKASAALIKQLQENPGELSAEDQTALDELERRNQASLDKLQALDALNPVVPPV